MKLGSDEAAAGHADAKSAVGVQPPGGCTSPNTNAHDPGGHGPHRVEPIAPDQLTSYGGNARTHSKGQNQQIVAGHGRVEAAKLLGLAAVPTLRLSHLSPTEQRAYVLADNKLAENAGWDRELLAVELQGLIDLDFEVELTGFEIPEIDIILEDADAAKAEGNGPEDRTPEPSPDSSVTQAGDLWLLGKHRVLCGSALKDGDYGRLLDREKAEFVFTDPPYNVPINGNVCGKGAIRHREFAMASGEMSKLGFIDFLSTTFRHLAAYSADGSIHDICMDWRHVEEMMAAGNSAYSNLKNICVWAKKNAGMGSFYRSRHEFIFIWKSGTASHINNFELGQHGRSRTNVWEYPGITSSGPARLAELSMHPTVKPVALVADAIRDCSKRGGIVLDPFLGSGTTVIAAERTGRRGRGIEIEPVYVDVAIKRWQQYTGKAATLVETGQTFEEVADARARSNVVPLADSQGQLSLLREAA